MYRKLTILFISLLSLTTSDNWMTLSSGSAYIPPHVYQIQLNSNQTLEGQLVWKGKEAEFKLYLYKQEANILSDSQFFMSYSSQYKEILSFRFFSQQCKKYFVKIYPFKLDLNKFVNYSLKIKQQSKYVSYQGVFHQNYPNSTIITIPNKFSFNNIAFRYSLSSTINISSNIYYLTNSINLIPNQVGYACINNQSTLQDFVFTIKFNKQQAYSLSNINYTLEYLINYPQCDTICPDNLYWNDDTQNCQIQIKKITKSKGKSGSKSRVRYEGEEISQYLGYIIPSLLSLFLVFCIIDLCKKMEMCGFRQDDIQDDEVIDTMEDINITEADQKCCICLIQLCNVQLSCKHYFHRQCIQQWITKNNLCPLCRKKITRPAQQKKCTNIF